MRDKTNSALFKTVKSKYLVILQHSHVFTQNLILESDTPKNVLNSGTLLSYTNSEIL